MSQRTTIKELLQKFVKNECDDSEIEILIAYFKEAKGTGDLPDPEEIKQWLATLSREEQGTRTTSHKILEAAKKREKSAPVRKIWRYASVAAVFIGLFTLGYFYQQGAFNTVSEELLIPANESITLKLEDGTIEVIDPGDTKAIRNARGNVVGNQNQSQLVYSEEPDTEQLVYNTLTVPYGKRFEVVLSDGTAVYMNAGTQLTYPISFLSTGNREVFVSGEAYFDVTSDTQRPFIVNAEELNVEVLGTEFNVLAYPEDGVSDVVLVEGSVGMYNDKTRIDQATVLTPGTKGSFDKSAANIVIEQVNTKVYTSWRNGELVYRNLPFKHILKKLERHYNIKLVLNNPELGEEPFSASFENKSIEEVLSFFDDIYDVEYSIENNTVYIK